MPGFKLDRKLVTGLLCGVGLGLASAALLCPRCRSRVGEALRDGALVVADRLTSPGRDGSTRVDRRAERAGRVLTGRIERMRSAGF